MNRCFMLAITAAAFSCALPAAAQVSREFPQDALRGNIVFVAPPQISLNGSAARLAAGHQVRRLDNRLIKSSSLAGSSATVNYTVDHAGTVKRVWLLRPEEAANKPWPATEEESRSWSFDAGAQRWTRP